MHYAEAFEKFRYNPLKTWKLIREIANASKIKHHSAPISLNI